METTRIVFTALLPIFFIIGAGFVARRAGWLSESADGSLMKLVVNVLYPALIFNFILGNDALKEPSNIFVPPLVGAVSILAGFGIAFWFAKRIRLNPGPEQRTFAFAAGLYNYGYFPIPIIAFLFDRETTGVLLVHNVGVEIVMWVLGVGFILSANDPKPIWKRILSAPVISILVAVPLNLLGAGDWLPNASLVAFDLLGQSAIPMGLILTGATFADLLRTSQLNQNLHIPGVACFLRLGLIPLCMVLALWILPVSKELENVMIIQAAMPCAVFPIVLARHFNGSPEIALKLVLSTTILSFATIPFWIWLGLKLTEN